MLWLLPLKRYAQFSGRSGRAEYWQFVGVYILALIVMSAIEGVDRRGHPGTLTSLIFVGAIVPNYAVAVRRLHDRGISGWLLAAMWLVQLAAFMFDTIHQQFDGMIIGLPFLLAYWVAVAAALGLVGYLVYQLCMPGDPETNRFGPPPVESSSAPTASASTPAAPSSEIDQLERLAQLRRDGALTEVEYQQQKAAVLGGGRP